MSEGNDVRRAYVETYGCQMNISDGELMEGILEAQGYRLVTSPEEADVVLVNTCAIRENAERRVLGRVSQLNALKRERPEMVLGVTGCMAQRLGEKLLEDAPYVDLVMGPDGYRSLPEKLAGLGNGASARGPTPSAGGHAAVTRQRKNTSRRGLQLSVLTLDPRENYQGLEQRRRSSVTAWVPIQRGCDHRCTYCIVPYVRGPEKNRDPLEVLNEIRGLAEEGITEVTLLGQTVNSYRNGDWAFPRLLQAVARVDGIRRVRFTSPHPNDVTPDLVEVMATESAVCEQLHLPVQAGSDRSLKRMVRRYTVASFMEKVEMVRSGIPDLALSTDVIVAFPGETHAEYRETLSLLEEVRFDEAFTYRFSPRDGTPATRFPAEDTVDDQEAKERLSTLIQVTRRIQGEINQTEVGRREEILLERQGRDEATLLGRTRRNKAVVAAAAPDRVGAYMEVELIRTTGATFVGEPVERTSLVGVP
ncbi:MAG: MiaB/RimO family radical SAM methylthiotransferase [Gemmatimonadota bacterium]